MNEIDKLEAWGQKMANALLWCQTNLKPGTWHYQGDTIEIDNDRDYTMFILSNNL